MYKRLLSLLMICVMGLTISAPPAPAVAAPGGGPYALTWVTVDGGGGLSSGGPYDLYLTLGQPDAWSRVCGDDLFSGGFWPTLKSTSPCLHYLPFVER